MEKVFVYGSLMDPEIQKQLFNRTVAPKFNAVLPNWTLKTDKQYPYITPSVNSKVEGFVVLLTAKELAAADNWEQVPVFYKRRLLNVEIKQGKKIQVWGYVGAE